jgi:hypothetical protein
VSDEGDAPIFYVPDDGRRYSIGMRVRVDRSRGSPDVIPDLRGDYEVHDWRRETGMAGGPPLARVELRRIGT